MEQNHLRYEERINLGSYYTKPSLVSLAYSIIRNNVEDFASYTLLDTSCGYGSFFQAKELPQHKVGVDIDELALKKAAATNPGVVFFCQNSLKDVSRCRYQLSAADKVIIVGNPPYNDNTSLIRKALKKDFQNIDPELTARDLGISFLLSYNKLRADYVCVLHPLSYLIKRANFALLEQFSHKYRLIDAIIISSGEFTETSRATAFPIIVALYQHDERGMDYRFIQNYSFSTKEGKSFRLTDWEPVSRYITKYPNQKHVGKHEVVAKFWTMRDINALKRSRTFINEDSPNAILVTTQKLDYYCYVDVFKRYIVHVPYYLGNCEVMIDNTAFSEIKNTFRYLSLKQHPEIRDSFEHNMNIKYCLDDIEAYFKKMLGEHYVY